MVLNLKQASKPQIGRGRKMSKPQQGFAKLRKAAFRTSREDVQRH